MNNISTLLRDVFGLDQFRSGQQDIVEAACALENVLAIMPTGAANLDAINFQRCCATV